MKKKSANVCLTIFSSFSLLALILLIAAIAINSSSYFDNYSQNYQTFLNLVNATQIFVIISIIGVFVCSIVCLVKSKHFTKKGLIKGSSIVGIVGSGIGLIFWIIFWMITYNTNPNLLILPIILLIVCFGLSLGSLKHINNELKNQNI